MHSESCPFRLVILAGLLLGLRLNFMIDLVKTQGSGGSFSMDVALQQT